MTKKNQYALLHRSIAMVLSCVIAAMMCVPVSASQTDNTGEADSNFLLTMGAIATEFAANSIGYGVNSGDNSIYLVPGSDNTIALDDFYGDTAQKVASIQYNTLTIEKTGSTVDRIFVPLQLKYTVPAGNTVQIKYVLNLSSVGMQGEYALGIINGATTPDNTDPKTGTTLFESSDIVALDGKNSSRNVCYISSTLDQSKYDETLPKDAVNQELWDEIYGIVAKLGVVPTVTQTGRMIMPDETKTFHALLEKNDVLYIMNSRDGKNLLVDVEGYVPARKDNPILREQYSRATSSGNKEITGYLNFVFDNSKSKTDAVFIRTIGVYLVHQVYDGSGISDSDAVTNVKAQLMVTPTVVSEHNVYKEEEIEATTLTWEPIYPNDLSDIEDASDCDYRTSTGWYRLLMELEDKTHTDAGKELEVTGNKKSLSGKVSGSGFTTVQEYFTHPLGAYLRHAWLYNGSYSTVGGEGADYASPQAVIKTRDRTDKLEQSDAIHNDYDAWYIKYAGDDGKGNAVYYLAMEGTDGKRYLLVNNFSMAGYSGVKTVQTFATAADYDTCTELYQYGYCWPTNYEKAKKLTSNDDILHEDKGVWYLNQNDDVGDQISEENLKEEAFRIPVKDNLKWSISVNGVTGCLNGFISQLSVDTAAFEATATDTSTLYYYYKKYSGSNTTHGKILEKYKNLIQQALNVASGKTAIPKVYMGLTYETLIKVTEPIDGVVSSDNEGQNSVTERVLSIQMPSESTWFRVLSSSDKACDLQLYLGTYQEDHEFEYGIVQSGETRVISGSSSIDSDTMLVVEKGGTLQILGDLVVKGGLACYGNVYIESGGCLRTDKNGSLSFAGGNLTIAKNGVLRRYETDKGNLKFTANSTVYNDGLFISPYGCVLEGSTFENGSNGVILLGANLKKDFDQGGIAEEVAAFPRGNPTAEQRATLKTTTLSVDATSLLLRRTMSGYTAEQMYGLILKDYSILINNGAIYDISGIMGSNCIVMGTDTFLSYKDIFEQGLSIYADKMDSTVYDAIGKQTIADALTGSTTTYEAWRDKYNAAGYYKEPPKNNGC